MRIAKKISLFICFFLFIVGCGGTSTGTKDGTLPRSGSRGEDQNTPNDNKAIAPDGAGAAHSHEWPPGEGGQEGLFTITGQMVVKGGTPTLGSDCGKDAFLLERSNDTAGKIYLGGVAQCTVNFSKEFSGTPICVVSGGPDAAMALTYKDGNYILIKKAGGGSFDYLEVINYICLGI